MSIERATAHMLKHGTIPAWDTAAAKAWEPCWSKPYAPPLGNGPQDGTSGAWEIVGVILCSGLAIAIYAVIRGMVAGVLRAMGMAGELAQQAGEKWPVILLGAALLVFIDISFYRIGRWVAAKRIKPR